MTTLDLARLCRADALTRRVGAASGGLRAIDRGAVLRDAARAGLLVVSFNVFLFAQLGAAVHTATVEQLTKGSGLAGQMLGGMLMLDPASMRLAEVVLGRTG